VHRIFESFQALIAGCFERITQRGQRPCPRTIAGVQRLLEIGVSVLDSSFNALDQVVYFKWLSE
jgi:hypothetical protein